MKCDHLIGRTFNGEVYVLASEAMEAIAELKEKLMPCLNGDCILTCEVVEKYGKENAELKQKLEDVQASAYAEMVDAGMRERRLRRALWLARAMRAEAQWNRLLRDAGICFAVGRCKEWDKFNTIQKKWQVVERKCRAKAEEYK